MTAQITIKQGASFMLALAFVAPGNVAVDLTGAALHGQLRDVVGNLVAELTPTVVSPATGGQATIGPLSTAGWTLGRLIGDISLTSSAGAVSISDTFGVMVLPAVTVPGT